jgi:magnesium chelatase accessory protein
MRVKDARPAAPTAGAWLRERSVDAGGLRWHVQQMGQGTSPTPGDRPLLLLHGTGASTHSWRALAPLLSAHTDLLAVDLPGHARSGPLPPGRRSLPGMAAATGDLLRTLGVTPRAVLGHSAGAAVMLRLALDGGLDGASLIGLNAALQPLEGWAGYLFPPLARLLAMNPLVPRLAAWRAQQGSTVRRLIDATGSSIDDDGVAHYTRLLRNPRHVAGVLAMTANWDLQPLQQDLLHRLNRPLHLLVGQADGTVPPAQAEQLAARLALVKLQVLPGLGHLAHEEAPQRVADAVRPLLGGG